MEPQVWSDIETFLRDPGEILKDLAQERDDDVSAVVQEAERMTLEKAMEQLAQRRKNSIDIRTRGSITNKEFDGLLDEVAREQSKIEERLQVLKPETEKEPEPINEDLLTEIRHRLDSGLTPLQKQEIVRLLVKRITIYTEGEGKARKVRAVIEYRFTKPSSVAVPTATGRGSSRPPA